MQQGGSIPHPTGLLCTLRRGRRLPRRNTRYRAGATPYPDRTFTGWNAPAFLAHQWPALKQQFGPDYHAMGQFKAKFRVTLRQVQARYKAAQIELDSSGMRLHNSPPPVTKRLVALPR